MMLITTTKHIGSFTSVSSIRILHLVEAHVLTVGHARTSLLAPGAGFVNLIGILIGALRCMCLFSIISDQGNYFGFTALH